MSKTKKSTESANLCSMSFLKVLKSRIRKTDRKSVKNYSDSKMPRLDVFNGSFRAITS